MNGDYMNKKKITQTWSPQYQELVNRNIGLLSEAQQDRLKKARFCVFGMGGIGSPAFDILVRCGIEHFAIVDNDVFDASNMNRQIFATLETIGQKKVAVAKNWAQSINPDVRVDTYERVREDNVAHIITGADIIVLAIDELMPCLITSREAYKQSIPLIEGWAIPFGNVRVHTVDTPPLEAAYQLPTLEKNLDDFSEDEIRKLGLEVLMGLGRIEGVADYYSDEVVQLISRGLIPSFAPLVWLTSVHMALEAIKVFLAGEGIFQNQEIAFGPDFRLYDPFRHRIPKVLEALPPNRDFSTQ